MLLAPVMPQPRITIDPRDTVLQVINAALRKGTQEEQQVIAGETDGEVDSPVRLLVVDVDPERGTYYFQSWESPTDATDNRIFSLAVKDLIGDHDVQIEASGMNKDGKLTLDIFRRGQDPHGTELVYVPVCQIVADDIHVEESDRPTPTRWTRKTVTASRSIRSFVTRIPRTSWTSSRSPINGTPKEGRYVPGSPERSREKKPPRGRSSASSSAT